MCGKSEERLFKTLIEEVEMGVCSSCSKFGKVIAPVHRPGPKEQHQQFIKQQENKGEKIEILADDYPVIIKKGRESLGLTQKDFANRLSEKESVIHKIETGTFVPALSLAKKLEKILGVKLVEEHLEKHEPARRKKEDVFTLGDFINVKNR